MNDTVQEMKTEERKSCQCDACRRACHMKPGWFLPEEMQTFFDFLKMEPKEAFKRHLAIDWYEGKHKNVFILSPVITDGTPGDLFPADPTGCCSLYDKETGSCTIHGAAPYECKEYMHDDTIGTVQERHRYVSEAWDNEKAQKLIEDLYGSSIPEPPSYGLLDMLW